MPYYTYILRCSDKTLYTGCTNNIEQRVKRHNDKRGAKYTAGRRPVTLVYLERFVTLKAARRREARLQGWPREKKENLIQYGPSTKK